MECDGYHCEQVRGRRCARGPDNAASSPKAIEGVPTAKRARAKPAPKSEATSEAKPVDDREKAFQVKTKYVQYTAQAAQLLRLVETEERYSWARNTPVAAAVSEEAARLQEKADDPGIQFLLANDPAELRRHFGSEKDLAKVLAAWLGLAPQVALLEGAIGRFLRMAKAF